MAERPIVNVERKNAPNVPNVGARALIASISRYHAEYIYAYARGAVFFCGFCRLGAKNPLCALFRRYASPARDGKARKDRVGAEGDGARARRT